MSKKRSINNGNKRILEIAIPSIISNITVPLLGLIDVTIVGHLGAPAYIGAIAVGGLLFNIIYWIFGFLRMGTSGMTSQAYGKRDLDEVSRLLLRSVGVGLFIAFCLLLLQYPIQKTAFTFIKTSREVQELATLYFRICIWGAPAMLPLALSLPNMPVFSWRCCYGYIIINHYGNVSLSKESGKGKPCPVFSL